MVVIAMMVMMMIWNRNVVVRPCIERLGGRAVRIVPTEGRSPLVHASQLYL